MKFTNLSINTETGKAVDVPINGHLLAGFLFHKFGDRVICGVEIGCNVGTTAVALLKELPNLGLYTIDPWKVYNSNVYRDPLNTKTTRQVDYDNRYQKAVKKLSNFGERYKILRMESKVAAEFLVPYSFDFVFIDGNHSYEAVKMDIELWLPKTKILIGHDFHWGTVRKSVIDNLPVVGTFGPKKERQTFWYYETERSHNKC